MCILEADANTEMDGSHVAIQGTYLIIDAN